MADIKYIRLLSGENVIAEYEQTGDLVKLTNAIIAVPTGNNLGFLPLAALADKSVKTIEIDRSHVVFVTEVAGEILSHYQEQFGSIITPKKPTLVGV